MILEDQYKQAQNELALKKEAFKARPSTAAMKKDAGLAKTLEN